MPNHPRTYFCTLFVLFALSFFLKAKPIIQPQDTSYYMELKVSTKEGKKNLEGVTVTVTVDSIIQYRKLESDKSGRCKVQLALNKKYVVKFSKPGYVTKVITVNTTLPREKRAFYQFQFAIDIFREVPGLDVSVLKEPIAKIQYNSFIQQFDYDANYTIQVNEELKKLYDQYYKIQKEQEGKKK